MASTSVYLPDDLLERMKDRKDINWSQIARRAFYNVLDGKEELATLDSLEEKLCEVRDLLRRGTLIIPK